MDVEKIYKEVSAEEVAWLNLNSSFDLLSLFLTEVEHPEKKSLEKKIESYTQDEINSLKQENHDAEKPITLRVLVSDLESIGKQFQKYELLEKENVQLREIATKYKEAKKIYFSDPDARKDKLAVKAVQILGWSTGKRPKRISENDILQEYMSLINDKTPKEKWEALDFLAKKYGLADQKAALRHVQAGIKKFKDGYKLLCSHWGYSHLAAKINPDKYTGILPPNWPSSKK